MTDIELNNLLRQLEAEFEAKYPIMTVSLRANKKRKITGLMITIRYRNNRVYYTCSFTENTSITTLRRHLYDIVNRKGEEYARKQKRISKPGKADI